MSPRRYLPLAIIAAAAGVVLFWPSTQPADEGAMPTTTTTTTTTLPPLPGVYGASWQVLEGSPVASRARMALSPMGDRVFTWGGTVPGVTDPGLDPDLFYDDGFIYDPGLGRWVPLPPVGFDLCPLADPAAIEGGYWAPVVLWGRFDGAPGRTCVPAAAYHPESRTWRPLEGRFFEEIGSSTTVIWEEGAGDDDGPARDRLLAPEVGLAYDLATGATSSLGGGSTRVVPLGGEGTTSTTWTGDWLLSVDVGLVYGWERATETWRWNLGGTPVESAGQDMVATDLGVVLVNQRLEAAVLVDPSVPLWSPFEALPLRASGCRPDVASAGGVPVVLSCVGVAVYDSGGLGWVPFPPPVGLEGDLLATPDALYWFSRQVSRLPISRGGVVPPRKLPLGLSDIELPDGYHFVRSIGLVRTTDADHRVLSEVHGFEVSTAQGRGCRLLASYQPFVTMPVPAGEVSVARDGLPPLEVLDYSDGEGARFVVETSRSDVIEIRCDSRDDGIEVVAALQWIKM